MRTFLWLVLGAVALVLVGSLVVSLFGALLKLVFYLIIGAAVVGGGMYLYGRAKKNLGWNRRGQLPRS